MTLKFRSKVWLYAGPGGWHFISLPESRARQIKASVHGVRRGWGSVPVTASIGKTSWKTSVFPDRKSGSYVLPIKAEVRKTEDVSHGDVVSVTLVLMI